MASDRHPDRGTEGSRESEPDRSADPPAGIPSGPFDSETEGETGTEFAKAPSAAPDPDLDPEPAASLGESPLGQPTQSTYSGTTHPNPPNMLPGRERRRSGLERLFVRVIATGGVVGIGVAIAAILADSNVQGWTIGLVVAIVSVALSAILWSSRQM